MVNKNHDNELRQRVRALLEEDKDLRGYALNADVVEGEIQLQGIVDTLNEKEREGAGMPVKNTRLCPG